MTPGRVTLALCLMGAGLFGPHQAFSQSAVIIDQNRADRAAPAPAPEAPAPKGGGQALPVQAAITPFTVTGVRLEKASIRPAQLGGAFRPFIGQRMDAAGLNALAQATAAAYAKSDVALYTVLVPVQDFSGGMVRMRVIEGYIASIDVRDLGGAKAYLPRVRSMAARLLAQRPLSKASLERAILLIRDLPGVSADVQLLKAPADGAVTLSIGVKRQLIEAGVGVNDRGTAALGQTQVSGTLIGNGLLRPGERTSFTVMLPTDPSLFQYYAIAHSELLNDDGLTGQVSFGYLHTRPKIFPLEGSATTAGASLSYPVIRSNARNLTVTGSLDGTNSDNAFLGRAFSADHTRAVRGAAAFSQILGKVTVAASGAASLGLDVLGAQVTSDLLSNKDFRKVNLRAGLDYAFVPQWALRLRAAGQYSGDRLPAAEQMALGGDEFGRAFPSAAVVGDSGAAGSAELAYAPKHLPSLLKGSELFGFVDGGELWSLDRTIVPAQTYELASAGFGARMAVTTKTAFQLEADTALKSPIPDAYGGWRVVAAVRTLY